MTPTLALALFTASGIAALALLVVAVRWALTGFNLGRFLTKSFCDSLGVPDASRLTQFVITLLLSACIVTGLVTHRWAPDYIIIPLLAAVTGQSLAGAWENRGKQTSDAAVAQASLTGQPVPGPTSATTTTSTTLQSE
jgi:hypothetical protein